MSEPAPESSEPRPLSGLGRVAAPIWVAAVVLLYLAVRELGVRFVLP